MKKITVLVKSIKPDKQMEEGDPVKHFFNGYYLWKNCDDDILNNNKLIDMEFKKHINDKLRKSETMFESMLMCLDEQKYKNFEFVLVHRHPETIDISIFEKYQDKFPIKIIKSKHTPWNDAGEQYSDFTNNCNTGIIWSEGEIVHIMNDECLFGKNYLSEVAKYYNSGYYGVARRKQYAYMENYYKNTPDIYWYPPINTGSVKELYSEPVRLINGIPATNLKVGGDSYMWGYGCTFNLKQAIEVNGYNELLDGWFNCDDFEFECRLRTKFDIKPKMMKHNMYSTVTPNTKYRSPEEYKFNCIKFLRDTKRIEGFKSNYETANTWCIDKEELDNYLINNQKSFEFDKNIYILTKERFFDLKELRERRDNDKVNCGKRIL